MISTTCFPYVIPQPEPSYEWHTCFNSLDEMQNWGKDYWGRWSIVPDPTGSGRGNVLLAEAAPDLAYFDEQYLPDGRTVVRSYPSWYPVPQPGAHLVGVDVYVKSDFSPGIKSTSDGPHLSLLGDFYDNAIAGTAWEYTAAAGFARPVNGKYYLDLSSKWGYAEHLSSASQFTFNQWHRIELSFTADRKLYLYQDGQLIAKMTIPADFPLVEGGGHPGLYGLSANGAHIPPFQTGTLYNDNWSMVVWP